MCLRKSAPDVCRGRDRSYLPPPAQIPACGFPAPGSCRRSNATGIRGLGGPSSSGPWAQAVGDIRFRLCVRGMRWPLPFLRPAAFPPRSPPSARRPALFEASSVLCSRPTPPTFRPASAPRLPEPARDRRGGCGRQEVSQVPTRSLTARTGLRLRWSGGPSQNGPAHVACGGSQRLGLHGKNFSKLNTVLVVSLCTLRDHRRR